MKVIYNLVFLVAWHYVIFLIISKPNHAFYYRDCNEFDPSFFKKKEKVYEKVFKIKVWKDLVPQYTRKAGFSKRNMLNLKIDYIKEFVAETYRAELDHLFCCLVTPFMFLVNSFGCSMIFSVLVFIFNMPCILIQRYNRFRLRRLMINMKKHSRNGDIEYSFWRI